ncbi:MAG: glycosyltransferase [Acetatifactor sp.]|nr:glycosyltransferase [Acetatifactor sp.]
MNVYQVNVVCGSGSTGRIAVDISRELCRRGHNCRIAYGRGKAPDDVDSIKIDSTLEVLNHVIMTRLFDRHGLHSNKATQRLINDIIDYAPDVIHLHNIHGYYVNYKTLFDFLKSYGKPVVWTLHDCWAFTGHCAHYEYINCDKWECECYGCLRKKTYPAAYLFDRSKKNYLQKKESLLGINGLTLVTPSMWLRNEVRKSFLRSYPIEVINNGIDLDIFHFRESNVRGRLGNPKYLVLGVASVWTETKGFYDFFRLRELLGTDYCILLVGVTKEQRKNLPEGIIGIERTESAENLAELYSAADVFVNMTYEDTFPTVNNEAIACGTPVVVYNTGGNAEMIKTGDGKVVNRGDICGIKECIEEIVIKKKLVDRNMKSLDSLDRSKMADHYITLYNNTVICGEEN